MADSSASDSLLVSTNDHQNHQNINSPPQYVDAASEKPLASGGKKRHTIDRVVSTYWLFEVLCGTLSLACLIAITVVLRAFDNQPVPTWSYGITLNTIVSLLASVATFSLIVPITASLNQLKWLWFRERRSLVDFEILENASRGLVGSIYLLLRRKGG
ncbi:Protein of unknown function (DUF3176) domain containing protein [Elaphomyces granulatus]|jgi:hypothetical protein